MSVRASWNGLVVSLAVALPLGACALESSEPTEVTGQPIIDGRSAFGKELDAVVMILIETPGDPRFRGPTERSFCSGTLIDATHVITAKHCLAPIARVVVGADQRALSDAFLGGEDVTANAEADDVAGTPAESHDLGMFRLKTPIGGVKPIDVDLTPLTRADLGKTVIAVGFGERRHSDFVTRSAQRFKATQRLAGLKGNVFRTLFKSVDDLVAFLLRIENEPLSDAEKAEVRGMATDLFNTGAGDLIEGEQILTTPAPGATCFGDSGGPLLMERGGHLKVIGVVSSGTVGLRGTDGSNRWCRRGDLFAGVATDSAARFIREFRAR
jgi:hypothetical protein